MICDAGVLIGIDKDNKRIHALLATLTRRGESLIVPTPVIAQVWRDGARQTRLARFIASAEVDAIPLTLELARAAGRLLALSDSSDVVDAAVVVVAARYGHDIATSDPHDIRRLQPMTKVIAI